MITADDSVRRARLHRAGDRAGLTREALIGGVMREANVDRLTAEKAVHEVISALWHNPAWCDSLDLGRDSDRA